MSKVKTAKQRLKVLKYAKRINNVKRTCEVFDISRTTFYSWKSRYEEIGIDGLTDKDRNNDTKSRDIKKVILNEFRKKPLISNKNYYDSKEGDVYRILSQYKTS